MDRLQRALTMAMALAWLGAARASAQDATPTLPPPRLSGAVYADYFYLTQGTTGTALLHGFRFRRVHLSYDAAVDSLHALRATLEAQEISPTAGVSEQVRFREAYLERRRFFGLGRLRAGLSPTPLFWTTERIWGYRSVEPTLLERQLIGPPTDMGIALQSAMDEERPLGWHLMFANGAGRLRETNRAKRATIAIPLDLQNVVLEGVVDFEGGPDDRDSYLLKVLLGWRSEHVGAGLETFRQVIKNSGLDGADVAPTGMSAFGRMRLRGRLAGFVRYDLFDPDAEVETFGYRQHFFLGGVDFAATPWMHVIPNVGVTAYGVKNNSLAERDSDVEYRLTLSIAYPP